MSGHRAPGQATRSAEHRKRSGRRPLIATLAAISLVAFGAAANAADDGIPDRNEPRTADTSEPGDASGTAPESDDVGATPPGEPPDGLGDDPELDALAQQCYNGDLLACDHLFLQSPTASSYEEYGDTCAGRQEPGSEDYCALAAVAGPTPIQPTPPQNLGTDPALDALANNCYIGNMDACDQLFAEAEPSSAYQIYGDTCAGRQDEGTGLYCRDLANPVPGTAPTGTTGVPTTGIGTDTTSTTTTTLPIIAGPIPPPTQLPTGLGTDPALNTLAQSCYDGDMAACDELFDASDLDSPYHAFGDTCAGRQPQDTGNWCVAAFGDGTTVTVAPPGTATIPPATIPPLTMPATVPPVTIPPVTIPPVTIPPVTIPPVTVPPVTIPPVTVPPVTIPPATFPLPTVPNVPTVPGTTPPATGPTLPPTTGPIGVVPAPTLTPTGLGTDPTLDALALNCYNGDLVACDDLWRQAEPESGYRNYGDTCAGRQPPQSGRWCVDAFAATAVTTVPTTPTTGTVTVVTAAGGIPPATQQPVGLGADPTLDALAQRCYDGDMQACDDLFRASALGSPYQNYGDTCAGRQNPGTFTYCHVAFPTAP